MAKKSIRTVLGLVIVVAALAGVEALPPKKPAGEPELQPAQ
jgi:hypothetical protein